jgi:hypothetical protein
MMISLCGLYQNHIQGIRPSDAIGLQVAISDDFPNYPDDSFNREDVNNTTSSVQRSFSHLDYIRQIQCQ